MSGAYVKPPIIGKHKWVASFDLASLYPHLIMQFNIGPDTLIENKRETILLDDILSKGYVNSSPYSMAANGTFYNKDYTSFLSELMKQLYDERVKFKNLEKEHAKKYEKSRNEDDKTKRDMYANFQWARKISLNSAYGAIGNQYFRFYDVRLAEAITISGQLVIKWVSKYLNEFLNKTLNTKDIDYIIAMDTDSAYLSLDNVIKDEKLSVQSNINILDKFCNDIITPFLKNSFDQLKTVMNAYENKMSMKREILADAGIWTGVKKRYALNVYDKEGVRYTYPEIKIVGMDAIKSTTPEDCRKRLKNSLRLIMKGNQKNLQNYIKMFREKFYKLSFEEISFPKKVNGVTKYTSSSGHYIKGTPIHCRGSIIYNKMINDKGLSGVYPLIEDGDKIRYSYLKVPNPVGENVLCIKTSLPKEFDLNKYIDYEMMFDKAFMEPLKPLLDVIGWSDRPRLSILELMKGK